MKRVALDDLAEVKLGRQRSPKNHSGDHMRPYLRAANVGWSGLILDDVKTMNFTELEMNTFRLRKDDLLLNEASGSASEVGKPALWANEIDECAFQNTLIRVRPQLDRVDPRYLLHYFAWQASSGAFARGARGVGIYHLGREALARWPVPLFDLAEQRRLAETIDLALGVRIRRKRVLDALDEVERSSFDELFSSSHEPRHSLAEHVVEHRVGLDRSSAQQGSSRSHEYVKMDAITSRGRLDVSSLTRVDASVGEVQRCSLADGDLLLNTRNSRELVGKTAVYRGQPRLYNNNIMRVRLDGSLLPDFVNRYLWSRAGQSQLEARKSGTTSVFAVYAKAFLSIEVPIPSRSQQEQFARIVARIEGQRRAATHALKVEDRLLASLQDSAFRGEL